MKNPKYAILLALFLVSFLSSLILVIYDFKPLPQICLPNEGCYIVKNSPYNALFFGIPNEYIGTAFFLALFLLTAFHIKNPGKKKYYLIAGGIIIAFIFSLYSIYLQIFMIKAYCKYCMVMDISSILAFVFALIFRK